MAATNPAVIKRVHETGGQNLVQGFANLLEDIGALPLHVLDGMNTDIRSLAAGVRPLAATIAHRS